MDKAVFGLMGVALGFLLTVAKEWWFQNRKNRKDVEYLCIQIACMLERFIGGCVEVVYDDGLCQGEYDSDGCRSTRVSPPNFEPEIVEVEWKSLPANLMYEVLNLPSNIEVANLRISGAFKYAASPPDYIEGFEERQFQYALLGIKASKLSSKLRNFSKLPERDMGDWNSVDFLKDKVQKIESLRKIRDEKQSIMLSDISNKQGGLSNDA